MQGWDDALDDPNSDVSIPMPTWNKGMEMTFRKKATLLRTTEDVNRAMYILYWWRVEYDLEDPIELDAP